MPSVTGIIVYRGLYFGMYDSLKPVILVGPLEGNFLASFLLGWGVTTGAGIASYPLDTIRRRMMMTSGEVSTSLYTATGWNGELILATGRQVQVLDRCWPTDHCKGGCPLSLQGCRRQHSSWCRWCWCSLAVRPGPAAALRQGLQGWIRLSGSSSDQHSSSIRPMHAAEDCGLDNNEDGVRRNALAELQIVVTCVALLAHKQCLHEDERNVVSKAMRALYISVAARVPLLLLSLDLFIASVRQKQQQHPSLCIKMLALFIGTIERSLSLSHSTLIVCYCS